MKINILLPYKEKFDIKFASSVSTTIKNNINYSEFKKEIRVFGRSVENPIYPDSFIGIKNSKIFFKSKNKFLAEQMCKIINNDNDRKQIIEIHNRPYLFKYIFKRVKNFPISLFFHNNSTEMSGSKTIKERQFLMENSKNIFCVSKFIKDKFLFGLKNIHNNVHVLYNGVERSLKKFPPKKKEILYVGRLVKEKGVDIYVKAISNIAQTFPEWNYYIIGSSHLGVKSEENIFVKKLLNDFDQIGNQARFEGFMSYINVQEKMKTASIIVVPSVWEEPFGLVVAEAMSNGIAVIASNVGGIPEIIGNNGITINDINEIKIENEIIGLINDKNKLNTLQRLSWNNFTMSAKNSSLMLDQHRKNTILNSGF